MSGYRTKPRVAVPRISRDEGARSGAALILTLLIVAMLTVVIVGFNASTRTEQIAARNYSYQVVASQMADLATEEAIATLQAAMEQALPADNNTASVARGFVSAPGMLASVKGAVTALASSNSSEVPTRPSDSAEFGRWVTGGANLSPGFVDLTNRSSGGTDRLIGRRAFFVDDETTKISLNSASGGRPPGSTNFFRRPFNITVVPPLSGAAGPLASYVANTDKAAPSFFFFPRQAKQLVTGAAGASLDWDSWLPNLTVVQDTRLNQPFRMANQPGSNPGEAINSLWNRTPWGAEKVSINQVAVDDGGVREVANALNDARLSDLFSGRGFNFKYPNVAQIAANMLMLRTRWWSRDNLEPGSGNFAPPAGAAPPFPLGYSRETYPAGYNFRTWPLPTGAESASSPNTPGTLKKTFGIPQSYFGAVPFPMLTKITPSVVYGWTAPNRMTVRILFDLEFFNPFPIDYNANAPGATARIVAQIDKARFEVLQDPPAVGPQWRGPDGTAAAITPHNDQPDWNPGFRGVWDPWGAGDPNGLDAGVNRQLFPADGIGVWPLPDVPARTNAVATIFFDVTFDEANPTARLVDPDTRPGNPDDGFIYCILDSIRILQDPENPATLRDWVSGFDFFEALAGNNGSQFRIPIDPSPGGSFVVSGPAAPLPNGVGDFGLAAPAPGLSMAKSDPRMRTPLDGKTGAWLGNQPRILLPSNFGPETELPGDQDFPEDPFQSVFPIVGDDYRALLKNGRYSNPEDFGRVFTGAPWRTLAVQAQAPGELQQGARTPAIPDWVVLDVFAVVQPPNGAGAVAAVPVNPNALGLSGSGPLALPARVATTLRSAAQPALPGAVLDNIANQNWSTAFARPGSTDNWRNVRSTRFGMPGGTILLPSEIAEISQVADFSGVLTSTNETRLSSLYPLLSTTSRFFAVYARGEALAPDRAGKPKIMATSQKKTIVEALVDADRGLVRIEKLVSEPYLD